VSVRSVRRSKSILTVLDVREEDAGLYTCTASSPSGTHSRLVRVEVRRRHSTTSTTTTTTSTSTTTSTTPAPAPAAQRVLWPLPPGQVSSCPVSGYCLNSGTCSYIAWLGELSCACAPGFTGRRCEAKATSALYSALRSPPSHYPWPPY
jgi:hypothetical protein